MKMGESRQGSDAGSPVPAKSPSAQKFLEGFQVPWGPEELHTLWSHIPHQYHILQNDIDNCLGLHSMYRQNDIDDA